MHMKSRLYDWHKWPHTHKSISFYTSKNAVNTGCGGVHLSPSNWEGEAGDSRVQGQPATLWDPL
jgi:hypothetical protein